MTSLATVVQQLRKERDQAHKRIEQLDQSVDGSTLFETTRGTVAQRADDLHAHTARFRNANSRYRFVGLFEGAKGKS